MRQRSYGRDRELTFRMSFTVLMLAMVWVAFISLLFWAGLNPILILVFALIAVLFQYFGSDKIVLMTTEYPDDGLQVVAQPRSSPLSRSPGFMPWWSDFQLWPTCRSPRR